MEVVEERVDSDEILDGLAKVHRGRPDTGIDG